MEIIKGDKIKNETIEKLGRNFGGLMHALYTEITWLSFSFIEYVELYGTDKERLVIMNKSAQVFFSMVQHILRDNLFLGIARITDPSESRGKKNMTIRAIPKFLDDAVFKIEIEKDLLDLKTKTRFCRDWRNRKIAHNDFDLMVNSNNAKPLEEATRIDLNNAIQKIYFIYNKVAIKCLAPESEINFAGFEYSKGAKDLLAVMEKGLKFDKF